MKNKQVKLLKRLLETPSATGTEAAVAALVRTHAADAADGVDTDVMGSVHARLKGSGAGPSLMLSAHMDEIGLMVTYISDDGFLSVAAVGGVDAAILPGLRVDVHASNAFEPLRGVVGRKPIHLIEPDERKNVTPLDKLVIDLGLPAKKVKKLVRVGDVATFGVGFERFGANMAVSRAFDDKAGVWIGLRVLQRLAKGPRPTGDFVFAATVQEEIGLRGAACVGHNVEADEAIVLEGTTSNDLGDVPAHLRVCSVGKGVAISFMDRASVSSRPVWQKLRDAAEEEGIAWQFKQFPATACPRACSACPAATSIPAPAWPPFPTSRRSTALPTAI